jgi:hypothetical protein
MYYEQRQSLKDFISMEVLIRKHRAVSLVPTPLNLEFFYTLFLQAIGTACLVLKDVGAYGPAPWKGSLLHPQGHTKSYFRCYAPRI